MTGGTNSSGGDRPIAAGDPSLAERAAPDTLTGNRRDAVLDPFERRHPDLPWLAARLALLQGLLDADGSPYCGGADLTLTSHRLAQDAVELARSLGAIGTVGERSRPAQPADLRLRRRGQARPPRLASAYPRRAPGAPVSPGAEARAGHR